MKAVQVQTPGGPEQLQLMEVPTPQPGPGEALVRIASSGVNFIDCYFRTGLYKADAPIAIGCLPLRSRNVVATAAASAAKSRNA